MEDPRAKNVLISKGKLGQGRSPAGMEFGWDGAGGSANAGHCWAFQFYATDGPFTSLLMSTVSGDEFPIKTLCGRLRNETFAWTGPQLTVVFSYHADTSTHMADEVRGCRYMHIYDQDQILTRSWTLTF